MSLFKKIITILVSIISIYLTISSIKLYNTFNVHKKTDYTFNSYYIKFEFNKEKEGFKLDDNNVTFIDYSKIKSLGVNNVISYNPVSISLAGLRFLQNNQKKLFISQANWLVNNIQDNGSWYIRHNKRIGKQTLLSPWNSALSQGLAISVLTRAYNLTLKEKYLLVARKALIPFTKYIEDGGIVSNNTFGNFYEEYPLKKHSTHVLNGFIYSLFGLYDLYKYDNNLKAKELFDKGIETLKEILPKYNLESWTRYDLNSERNLKNHWNYASPWYQKIHVAQLYGLYTITNDKFFLNYSNKFDNQNKYSWINLIIYPSYVLYTDYVKIYRYIKGQ